jgi:hypothetical protein
VESSLDGTDADLLVIFDCCFAGLLANEELRAAHPKKIFEFLGATPGNQTAIGPGAHSFTTALNWALQELSAQPEPFTIAQLVGTISRAPNFHDKGQQPVHSTRGKNTLLYRLELAPLSDKGPNSPSSSSETEKTTSDDADQVFLQLQLVLGHLPTAEEISGLAQHFKAAVTRDIMPLKGVHWKGLSKQKYQMGLFDVVQRKIAENRRLRRRNGTWPTPPKRPLQSDDEDQSPDRSESASKRSRR